MKSFLTGDDPDASLLGQGFRLMTFPVIVGLLFVGGVYWLRLQVYRSAAQAEPTAIVEVQLLPRPDPLPIPVSQSAQSTAVSATTPGKAPAETPADTSRNVLAALPAEETPPSEPAVPSRIPHLAADPAPNVAMLQFRDTLLRHIAKFQRYPRAAEGQHLQGTVLAVFSIGRDGKLLGTWVKTSSGQAVLDQAAMDTILRAQPLPQIPPALPDSMKVEVALAFDPL
jgi:periplasmic protein TonB